MWLLNQFHQAVRHELVPAIRADMGGSDPADRDGRAPRSVPSTRSRCCAGFPDTFEAAIGMSGTYRIRRFLEDRWSEDLYFASPIDFLPGLDGDDLSSLSNAA
jgi:hypothetical protein